MSKQPEDKDNPNTHLGKIVWDNLAEIHYTITEAPSILGFDFDGLDNALDDTLDTDESEMTSPQSVQAINELSQENAPAASSGHSRKSGYSNAPVVKTEFPLHTAAANGQLSKMKELIAEGYSIYDEDSRSAMPIHAASIFGQTEVVEFLCELEKQSSNRHPKSQLTDDSYQGLTALELAVSHDQLDVVRVLMAQGANPQSSNLQCDSAFDIAAKMLDATTGQLLYYPDSPKLMAKADTLIDILTEMSHGAKTTPYVYLANERVKVTSGGKQGIEQMPLSVFLEQICGQLPAKATRLKAAELIEALKINSDAHDNYILAKVFLNTFSTGKSYTVNPEGDKFVISGSEGIHEKFILKTFSESLHSFAKVAQQFDVFPHAKVVIDNMADSFVRAYALTNHLMDPNASNTALADYQQQKTLLLPTGWHGHSVACFFSKSQKIFAVANAGPGARYHGDKPGVHIYKLGESDTLSAKQIYEILSNQEQINLEFSKLYELGVLNEIATIEAPKQTFGNCTFYSFKLIIEAMAVVELMDQGLGFEDARQHAHTLYDNFELYHNLYLLDQLPKENCPLKSEPFLDVYQNLQSNAPHSEIAERTGQFLQKKFLTSLALTPHEETEAPTETKSALSSVFEFFGWGTSKGSKSHSHKASFELLDFESVFESNHQAKSSTTTTEPSATPVDESASFATQTEADLTPDLQTPTDDAF